MKEYFCWRCNQRMPFLEENEWQQIEPLLADTVKAIKEYRAENNCGLKEAKEKCELQITAKFEELTGQPINDYQIVYHHRLQNWGPECPECGHLLRSPSAKGCVSCDWNCIPFDWAKKDNK